MRKTKIVCTIGPKTDSLEMLEKLANAGMNIARINMSHGNHEYAAMVIRRIHHINTRLLFPVAMMLDTQGPEIRIGNLPKDVELKEGDTLKLSIDSACDEKEVGCSVATVNYVGLLRDVKKGDSILIDDGMIGLKVMSIDRYSARCMVMNPGKLSSKKCVNLPGVRVNLPSVTEKDISDI